MTAAQLPWRWSRWSLLLWSAKLKGREALTRQISCFLNESIRWLELGSSGLQPVKHCTMYDEYCNVRSLGIITNQYHRNSYKRGHHEDKQSGNHQPARGTGHGGGSGRQAGRYTGRKRSLLEFYQGTSVQRPARGGVERRGGTEGRQGVLPATCHHIPSMN